MSKVLIVSRVSSRKQNESQLVHLRHYCSENSFGVPNELEIQISGWSPKQTVVYHDKILKKLDEMKKKNTPSGGFVESIANWVLGEGNYKIIFTDPNRLSRNVNLTREFFRNLKRLSMTVDFIFIECSEANFTFDGSVEIPGNEKFWETVKAGETSSDEKSRMSKERALYKREKLEKNKITKKYSWVTLYDFVKETIRKGEIFETVRNTIDTEYDTIIPYPHLEYYNSIEEEIPDKISHVQCKECKKWRWVSEELYQEIDKNPEAPFTCSILVHCSCKIPMIYEDDPEYEPVVESEDDEPDEEEVKIYHLEEILDSQWSMEHNQYIYHTKWKRLRKNNPSWSTETEMLDWGLGDYLELWKKRGGHEFFLPGGKKAKT